MATHFLPFSSSLLDDALRPPTTQHTHSLPFNPVAVLISSVFFPPHERRVRLRVVQRQGRREREGVRGRAQLPISTPTSGRSILQTSVLLL